VTTYLLDANVLIALTVEEHEHHERVKAWIREVARVALCPLVEGSLVRFLVRTGESVSVVCDVGKHHKWVAQQFEARHGCLVVTGLRPDFWIFAALPRRASNRRPP